MAIWILGVSGLYHDAAAVLLRDGVVVAAAQEERFSRVKHDPSLPTKAVAWCLAEHGLRAQDLAMLVFYEKPLRKFERVVTTAVATFPRSWRSFPRAMHSWLGDKLWLRNKLVRTFGVRPDRVLFCEHHLSHAASAFLASPHRNAAILTVDGVGEWASTGLWRGSDQAPFIESLGEIRYPHSLGMLYSTLTAFLGFAVNNGEYKVMGMAPYGKPRFREELDKLVHVDDRGGFELNLDYFTFHHHPSRSYSDELVKLLGEPRFPGSDFVPELEADGQPAELVALSQRYADIAASVQQLTEDLLLHIVRHAHETVGGDALCLAGGVALNSVANQRIAREGPFEHLWIQPAAGDAGGAMGAALWAWHSVLGKPRAWQMEGTDLGKAWTRDQLRDVLDDLGFPYEDLGDSGAAAEAAADELAEGKVLGWMQGRFEWGPRALGHRSILADPRGGDMKDVVNARIKFREAFRPFAPATTEERAEEFFDVPPAAAAPARYMLTTAPVLEPKRAELAAVTHVDGSARVQTVTKARDPHYHRIIERFGEHTGVPVVLNTSFNLKGEPIVSGPIDGVATLLRCGLDALYMDGFRMAKPPEKR